MNRVGLASHFIAITKQMFKHDRTYYDISLILCTSYDIAILLLLMCESASDIRSSRNPNWEAKLERGPDSRGLFLGILLEAFLFDRAIVF